MILQTLNTLYCIILVVVTSLNMLKLIPVIDFGTA